MEHEYEQTLSPSSKWKTSRRQIETYGLRSQSPVRPAERSVERGLVWEARQAAEEDSDTELLVNEIPAIISGKTSKRAKRRYRQREKLERSKQESEGGVAGNNDDEFSAESVRSDGSDAGADAEGADDEDAALAVHEDDMLAGNKKTVSRRHATVEGAIPIQMAIRNKSDRTLNQ
ncbi:hypothetical protein LTR70_006100 [Exophiala xenobiotica]|uniref:Uncharacterized protein n=1 Tax=Lithohypha guttulata TaxID=1690604 RepID=A0ABR0K8M4_9EURO|nr:hypothetical protein LTR24_005664 [Lithohypha guttulata]KAK5316853.1 hypothetical protein LTR70_006100 [Exophiala xenobiotica]